MISVGRQLCLVLLAMTSTMCLALLCLHFCTYSYRALQCCCCTLANASRGDHRTYGITCHGCGSHSRAFCVHVTALVPSFTLFAANFLQSAVVSACMSDIVAKFCSRKVPLSHVLACISPVRHCRRLCCWLVLATSSGTTPQLESGLGAARQPCTSSSVVRSSSRTALPGPALLGHPVRITFEGRLYYATCMLK